MQSIFDFLQVVPLWAHITVVTFLLHWLMWLTAPMYRKELLKSNRGQLLGLIVMSAAPGVNMIALLFNLLVHVRWEILREWLAKPAFKQS